MKSARSRIVLTNDDGIDAPGLEALARTVAGLGLECVVVAPEECHSGGGHRVTTHRALAVREAGPGRFAVDGTPADCTRLAIARLVPDAGIVLSGINAGGNLGIDVWLSGTVAAAREAALHGLRAVAASQYRGRDAAIDWQRAAEWLAPVVAGLLDAPHTPGEFWNVNLPASPPAGRSPEAVACPVDPSPFALDFRDSPEGYHWAADYHRRPRRSRHDVEVCFGGDISVSRLAVT